MNGFISYSKDLGCLALAQAQDGGLDALGHALLWLGISVLDWCLLLQLLRFLLGGVYLKCTNMRQHQKVQCIMMHET
jgi:hypothetical protein